MEETRKRVRLVLLAGSVTSLPLPYGNNNDAIFRTHV